MPFNGDVVSKTDTLSRKENGLMEIVGPNEVTCKQVQSSVG